MKIAETFYSIQGEGKLTGVPSAFIRISGCNLRCTWCDTPYASWNPEGTDRSVDDLVAEVVASGARHVVLTGGEPLITPDIVPLAEKLHALRLHLTLETAGTLHRDLPIDLWSVSPKLSNSTPFLREQGRFARAHEAHRLNLPVLRTIIDTAKDLQFKFVVASETDLAEIDALLAQLPPLPPADILLMPEGTDPLTLRSRQGWLVDLCRQRGFRYCPRLHIDLFGNTPGT